MAHVGWALQQHPAGPGREEELVLRWLEPTLSGSRGGLMWGVESVSKAQQRVGMLLEPMLEGGMALIEGKVDSPLPSLL